MQFVSYTTATRYPCHRGTTIPYFRSPVLNQKMIRSVDNFSRSNLVFQHCICWLGKRNGNQPLKTSDTYPQSFPLDVKIWGADMVTWMGRGADLHMAQLMPLPFTISCSRKSRSVLVFTRDSIYAIARICHGNSVCPSVCPSHGWISQKRLKLGSLNFHHTVAPSL